MIQPKINVGRNREKIIHVHDIVLTHFWLNKLHQSPHFKLALVAQLDARPTGDQEVAVRPPPGQQHSFVEIW